MLLLLNFCLIVLPFSTVTEFAGSSMLLHVFLSGFVCVLVCFILFIFVLFSFVCNTSRKGNTLPCLVVKITGHNFVRV